MRKPLKKKIILEPDYKYSSLLVAKFINKIMQEGKKSIAEKIVYGAMERAEKEIKKPALETLDLALNNAGPQLELKSRRIGGANYQVPYEVRGERKMALAIRWIIDASRSQKGKPMQEKLAQELINACNNTGIAIKKKMDTHRMAEANKAFAHFAW
ncbi:MAG: 30S ribosomal protein S7 [Candidatus Yanofskybacteria bacterium RIFCSPHIGHO2_01_FULL_44_17]|uniref:Small ribosomal subunit protein uS7 n=1 Tax=Candidatus Yanofskybacteria bacterium RIFCSPHIGHO2_01_FULL_44_17 TaxID=1802668 RepID=A0A1F8ET78_9BACT|nr:MAG: 30S ribosomal protein S7 [Candidatus Yanofskybacteria bacterium RIFCSPHIGHO2_01_FULL_44_17]